MTSFFRLYGMSRHDICFPFQFSSRFESGNYIHKLIDRGNNQKEWLLNGQQNTIIQPKKGCYSKQPVEVTSPQDQDKDCSQMIAWRDSARTNSPPFRYPGYRA